MEATYQTPDGRIRLYLGDCLDVLPALPSGSVDAVVTDPPYSSGGFTRGDRTADPAAKYVSSGVQIIRESFDGDARDGRSWCYWMALWLSECRRIVRTSGYCLTFSDWRQMPLATDAIQAGGFVWRGVIVWNKGRSARAPHTGYFRHQAEYVVWGTSGVSLAADHGGPFDGVIDCQVILADKHHLTGKPTKLMEKLIEVVPSDSVCLDPFMGSGTTGVACARLGRQFIGVEKSPAYFDIAVNRIKAELNRQPLFAGQ